MADEIDPLTQLCKDLEAYETDQWAVDAILRHELMTYHVVDPCVGKGRMAQAARALGHEVHTMDIKDWSTVFPQAEKPMEVGDFLTSASPFPDNEATVFMNPPFSKACQFVDHSLDVLDAYKVICFQTFTWRSSDVRSDWWPKRPPARIWLCIDRASCFRFDVPEDCPMPEACTEKKQRKCLKQGCMSATPTTHAFFVWERGHTGTTINDLHKANKKPSRIAK